MNNFILDLHGLNEQEAIGKIQNILFDFEEGIYDLVEIITGRGHTLWIVVESLLEERGLTWDHPNGNEGSYLIVK